MYYYITIGWKSSLRVEPGVIGCDKLSAVVTPTYYIITTIINMRPAPTMLSYRDLSA